jgi:hypothetical protein
MGYSGDGTTCTDVNECKTGSPCDANATCTNTDGSFTCTCAAGYKGDGKTCTIMGCADVTCSKNAKCDDGGGTKSPSCKCNPGYSGDGTTCNDIDECMLGTAGCDVNATCTNLPGSFECTCNTGYSGTGLACSDIDECAPGGMNNCDVHASCTNTNGGFSCKCNSGYEGDGTKCTDIDECMQGTANCSINATCTNTDGGFTCACKPGTTGNGVDCNYYTSCRDMKNHEPGTKTGDFMIDADGPGGPGQAVQAHCDMDSDNGAAYTMVKITDASLGTGANAQDAYRAACGKLAMEVVVPRTKAHAMALTTWNGGPPNLVNIFPSKAGAVGLASWTGKCQGKPCSFYMSDVNTTCLGPQAGNGEPSGDNTLNGALFRHAAAPATGCVLGTWGDDVNDDVEVGGSVVCSTNDAGPDLSARASCKSWMDSNTVWNQTSDGISGTYGVDFDGAGPQPGQPVFCDQNNDGGGWTLAFLKNSLDKDNYGNFGGAYHNTASLATSPKFASSSAVGVVAVQTWVDLNAATYTKMKLGSYAGGNATSLSDPILKPVPGANVAKFGTDGYYMYNAPSTKDANTLYTWCGGQESFNDGKTPGVAPPGAPAGCKGHTSLGSGFDFSNKTTPNRGLTMCGADGSDWMYANYGSSQVSYLSAGAAYAIWIQ